MAILSSFYEEFFRYNGGRLAGLFYFILITDYFFLEPREFIDFLDPDEFTEFYLLLNESWLRF